LLLRPVKASYKVLTQEPVAVSVNMIMNSAALLNVRNLFTAEELPKKDSVTWTSWS
jgi:hypothetical protein